MLNPAAFGRAMQKTFSVGEANQLLPSLRRLLCKLARQRDEIAALNAEIEKARRKSDHDGGSPFGPLYLRGLEQFTDLVQEIENYGVIIKDYREGLCDFPHLHEGRIVYLCWKLGEEEVGWWHEVASGFAGRQPIEVLPHKQ